MALQVTVVRFEQLAKALEPIDFRSLGNVIVARPLHLMKAISPIFLTLEKSMEVIFLQSENAQYSIHPKDAGKLIDVKLVQP